MATLIRILFMISLAKRFITLRKEKGQAQPSVEAIKKIAIRLHVITDFLLFEEHEHGLGDDLALQLEAINQIRKVSRWSYGRCWRA